MTLPFIEQFNVTGKRVLVRVDFNVPIHDGIISDDSRIAAHLPTIEWLTNNGAKVILMGHLGRPEGEKNPDYTLKPIANRLARLLGSPVEFCNDCIGTEAEKTVAALNDGDVLLLENLRFYKEEQANDKGFTKKLASLADIYVSDAFGTAHRNHASIVGVPEHINQVALGHLMYNELEVLKKVLEKPEKPLLFITGGAKISSKIDILHHLLPKVDMMMVGGAMANTFLAAQGHSMGKSLYESDYMQEAKRILTDSAAMGCRILLPNDVVVAPTLEPDCETKTVAVDAIPANMMALDIGSKTIEIWAKMIKQAGTILWNGPMGVTEVEPFDKGTQGITEAIALSNAYSVAGGGDTLAALAKANMLNKVSYISTGGGALMEFLEGKTLPGIAALQKRKAA